MPHGFRNMGGVIIVLRRRRLTRLYRFRMITRELIEFKLMIKRGQLKSEILAGKLRILTIIVGIGRTSKREVKISQVLRRLITPLRSTRQLVKLS